MEWKLGDVVRLKSGGPKMTVEKKLSSTTGEVSCAWFNEKEKDVQRDIFRREVLEEVLELDSQIR